MSDDEAAHNEGNYNEGAYNDDIVPEVLNYYLEYLPHYFEMVFIDDANYDQLKQKFQTVQAKFLAGQIQPLEYVMEMQYICYGSPSLLEYFNRLANPRILRVCSPIVNLTQSFFLAPPKINYDAPTPNITIDYSKIEKTLAAKRVLDFNSKSESQSVSSVSEPSKVCKRKKCSSKSKKRSSSGSASETTDGNNFRREVRRELERSLNISSDRPDSEASMGDTAEPEVTSEVDDKAYTFYGVIICLLVVVMVLLLMNCSFFI